MSKHTRGKWKYHASGMMVMCPDGQMTLADIRGFGPLEKRLGSENAVKAMNANGKLMAAAPELLEALRDLFDHSDETMDQVSESIAAFKRAKELLERLDG